MLLNFLNKDLIEAGCDEAGRGCLSGPVFAAAVIWPKDLNIQDINDSKQLSEKNRIRLRAIIEENALAFAVASVSVKEIEEINILNASFLAMHRALDKLQISAEHLLIDGNRFNKYEKKEHTCIIRGDGKYTSIAAASILAKTYRDEYMLKLHRKHNIYGWDTNKGYGTLKHRKAILAHGLTKHHRRSFCQKILSGVTA